MGRRKILRRYPPRHPLITPVTVHLNLFKKEWDARRDTRSGPTFPLVTLGPDSFSLKKNILKFYFRFRFFDSDMFIVQKNDVTPLPNPTWPTFPRSPPITIQTWPTFACSPPITIHIPDIPKVWYTDWLYYYSGIV